MSTAGDFFSGSESIEMMLAALPSGRFAQRLEVSAILGGAARRRAFLRARTPAAAAP
jgi:hypothetical protein